MKFSVMPVILSGGNGTRLWPLSRAGYPKQFLNFGGDLSLFQNALKRINVPGESRAEISKIFVVTNELHKFIVKNQLREIGVNNADIILEPEAKNTAPALTLAALEAYADDSDPILVVCPADHVIQDAGSFSEALNVALEAADRGEIAIMGIEPDRAECGYGYIRYESDGPRKLCQTVLSFTEKPELAVAKRYLASGDYLWNAGIYVVKSSIWLAALKKHSPDIYSSVQKSWEEGKRQNQCFVPSAKLFNSVRSDSIDFAVAEKCAGSIDFPLSVVRLKADWNDLGAWDAVWSVGDHDESGNVTRGNSLLLDTQDSYIHADKRLVAVLGMNDVIVVDTPDAVLIAPKSKSQDVKKLVEKLSSGDRAELFAHRKVHRPWGWFDEIDMDNRFKVKRIYLDPGESISLQMHHHRAEHWIVVRGTAEVTCSNNTFLLGENQSTFIPLGEIHQLRNPGVIPLEIIEVQSGSYLGEDDIVRIKDQYGR